MIKLQEEMLIGFQTAFLMLLKRGQKTPPRSKCPVTIRVVMDALRDTGMIKIVEGQAQLTAEGHQLTEKLLKTQQRAADNLKSVPEEQIQKDMHSFLSLGLREIRKAFPAPSNKIGEWEPISQEEIDAMIANKSKISATIKRITETVTKQTELLKEVNKKLDQRS